MKKLLIGTYAGFDMDDPEDMSTHSWTLGTYETDEEINEVVDKEFDDFIDEEVGNRFDEEDPDYEENVKRFMGNFDVEKFNSRTDKLFEEDLVGTLNCVSDYYVETYKIYSIIIEK